MTLYTFLVPCGLAAALAFCPAARPLAPSRPPPAAADGCGGDPPQPDPALGMATADGTLRAFLVTHDDPHVCSWADSVGRYSSLALGTTPQAPLVTDLSLRDVRLRTRPLSMRYEPLPRSHTAIPPTCRPRRTSTHANPKIFVPPHAGPHRRMGRRALDPPCQGDIGTDLMVASAPCQ